MQFTIECPNDGGVEVSIEDVRSVYMRDDDLIEVVFECPECGEMISVLARVPQMLAAALEALEADGSDDDDRRLAGFLVIAQVDDDAIEFAQASSEANDPRIDAYCEYFRRELAAANGVEDMLAEMDEPQR
ncbi:MAG: hypothetical protein FDZ70_02485 [Actinobacteria bacterium]|nr:MAG: hypothetical protein FDZ70_02485 [Actinomycetota bacterium]